MDTYLLVHRQPHNYTGSPQIAAAWEAWFEKLGDALVDKGNAVLGDRAVADGVDMRLRCYRPIRHSS